jgi:hypothetical protein
VDMVTQACGPSNLGGRDRKIVAQGPMPPRAPKLSAFALCAASPLETNS